MEHWIRQFELAIRQACVGVVTSSKIYILDLHNIILYRNPGYRNPDFFRRRRKKPGKTS